jgi:hypothetical protein
MNHAPSLATRRWSAWSVKHTGYMHLRPFGQRREDIAETNAHDGLRLDGHKLRSATWARHTSSGISLLGTFLRGGGSGRSRGAAVSHAHAHAPAVGEPTAGSWMAAPCDAAAWETATCNAAACAAAACAAVTAGEGFSGTGGAGADFSGSAGAGFSGVGSGSSSSEDSSLGDLASAHPQHAHGPGRCYSRCRRG